jgi:hypothetical protein
MKSYGRMDDNVEHLTLMSDQPNTRSVHLSSFLSMTPQEFESAMTQLLNLLGYRAETTQLTADGGIDIWASDPRPIVGGRIIVQCKRYGASSTVGEPVVRDLFGLVHAHAISKGVIITTSTFTNAAKKFAIGKQVELIDGQQLLAIIQQCVQNLVSVPKSWVSGVIRCFSPFEAVLENFEDWDRSFPRPYSLRFGVTATEYLLETPDMSVEVDTTTGKPVACWSMPEAICPGIDYLKAEYLLVKDAFFRANAGPSSPAGEILARLRRSCDAFLMLSKDRDFGIGVEDYIHGNPNRDCQLDLVQENIENLCIKPWWKKHSRK